MTIIAVIVVAEGCSSCVVFKERHMRDMITAFAGAGVETTLHKASSLAGLGNNANPHYLRHVLFFPCIMLVDADLYASANLYPDRSVLEKCTIFNGEISSAAEDLILRPLRPPIYKMNKDDYKRFVLDHVAANTVLERTAGSGSSRSKRCGAVIPVNSYRR